jgi:hypothetical protein
LEKLQGELAQAQGQITGKDHYIFELEKQNDEFQSKIEKIGFESFMQIKGDLFLEDQETDRLVDLKKYVDVYDKYEVEVNEMVLKYK